MLIRKIVNYYVKNNTPKKNQFDMIIVNNRCIIFNQREYSYIYGFNNNTEGLYIVNSNSRTLELFLRWINNFPKSAYPIRDPIINIFLDINELSNLNVIKNDQVNMTLSKLPD